jgi:hypothetical protein
LNTGSNIGKSLPAQLPNTGAGLGLLTREALEKAHDYFEQAIDIDSEYAQGYSGLSLAWGSKKQMGIVSPKEANPKMIELSKQGNATG